MNPEFKFKFKNLEEQLREVLKCGYKVIPCRDYCDYKARRDKTKIMVNRIDIDFSVRKAEVLTRIFNELGIKGTFFVRLHADEYNPFSFENYRILKTIRDHGHEIGYHSEVVDQAAIWGEEAAACLKRDLEVLEKMLGIKVKGVASHGGRTGLNNLDFWKDRKPSDFGLLYEAYDRQKEFNLFQEALYVSDSDWTAWKAYEKGVFRQNDRRSLAEHAQAGWPILYSLIHPDTFYEEHFYQ